MLKAPPSFKGIISENGTCRPSPGKSPKMDIAATAFSVADLQAATNSFAQENLIGEGSLSRVYRGDFPNGQVPWILLSHESSLGIIMGRRVESSWTSWTSFTSRKNGIFSCAGICSEEARYICCTIAKQRRVSQCCVHYGSSAACKHHWAGGLLCWAWTALAGLPVCQPWHAQWCTSHIRRLCKADFMEHKSQDCFGSSSCPWVNVQSLASFCFPFSYNIIL